MQWRKFPVISKVTLPWEQTTGDVSTCAVTLVNTVNRDARGPKYVLIELYTIAKYFVFVYIMFVI